MNWDRQEWLRNIATIGVAMAIAGSIRYELQGELLLLSKILLIGGGVVILAALVIGYQSIIQFFSRRSARLGTNAATLIVSVVAILGFLNFLSYRHHKRVDMTTEKLFTLSDQTKRIVGGLKQDVDVYWFDKLPDVEFQDRIGEYRNLSAHLHFKFVDPQEHPEVARDLGVAHMKQAVVASGAKHQLLEATNEQDITNAIVKVTRATQKTVCFVEGHGEKAITANDADGFAGVNNALIQESYLTKSFNLATDSGVPTDCSLVVIAGPKQGFLPAEAQLLAKYLDDGGKVFIMVDPETDPKLDNVFSAWNIKVGDNVVVDASALSQVSQMGPFVPIVVTYGNSPITKTFGNAMTFYPLARTVSIADKNKTQEGTTELMKSSTRSFTIPKLDPSVKEIKYDATKDTLGPLSLGVASERRAGPEPSPKDGRLVVIGNSQFASNQAAGQVRNADLFMNTVNWLAEDEDLISIRPKSATSRRVTFTETQSRELNWFSLLLLPGIVILSGVYIWWKRR
jgi:gliding motility-associatede transport system auxiliary component